MTTPVLSVRDLHVEFANRRGALHAINGVSFDIARGEVLGVVGESGAGKSVTGLAAIGLIDPPGRISGGEIHLSGAPFDAHRNEPALPSAGSGSGACRSPTVIPNSRRIPRLGPPGQRG